MVMRGDGASVWWGSWKVGARGTGGHGTTTTTTRGRAGAPGIFTHRAVVVPGGLAAVVCFSYTWLTPLPAARDPALLGSSRRGNLPPFLPFPASSPPTQGGVGQGRATRASCAAKIKDKQGIEQQRVYLDWAQICVTCTPANGCVEVTCTMLA